MKKIVAQALMLGFLAVQPVQALINIPSDGSDGAAHFSGAVQIDLGAAPTANWDAASTTPGRGIYDPEKWAVVFKYSSVTIDPITTVTFKNHPTGAPVVWLVQGSVLSSGSIVLDGQTGHSPTERYYAEGGPGGFRGGVADLPLSYGSSGFGIGGGRGWVLTNPSGGAYATRGNYSSQPAMTYGNPRVLPLIGGSGGSGASFASGTQRGGGGGGGAILIACRDTIALDRDAITGDGGIYACGGSGAAGGSGGGIRLVAERIVGNGYVLAIGGGVGVGGTMGEPGGDGRICLEAAVLTLAGPAGPGATIIQPVEKTPPIWPAASTPRIRLVSLGGKPLPPDPGGPYAPGGISVTLDTAGNQELVLQTENVPTTWTVNVLRTPLTGVMEGFPAAFQSGTEASATWTATINTVTGVQALQARAFMP